jgi:hypothetical protein
VHCGEAHSSAYAGCKVKKEKLKLIKSRKDEVNLSKAINKNSLQINDFPSLMQTQNNTNQPKNQPASNNSLLYSKVASIPKYFNQHESKLTPNQNIGTQQFQDNIQDQFKLLSEKMQQLLEGQTIIANLQHKVNTLEIENTTLKQEISTLKTDIEIIKQNQSDNSTRISSNQVLGNRLISSFADLFFIFSGAKKTLNEADTSRFATNLSSFMENLGVLNSPEQIKSKLDTLTNPNRDKRNSLNGNKSIPQNQNQSQTQKKNPNTQ